MIKSKKNPTHYQVKACDTFGNCIEATDKYAKLIIALFFAVLAAQLYLAYR